MTRVLSVEGDEAIVAAMQQLDNPEFSRRIRRGLRAGAAILRQEVRRRAPRKPRSLRKTRTHEPSKYAVKISATTPLANIWEAGGAGPHTIGEPGQLLSNRNSPDWSRRPFVARGPVQHPGFRARPSWRPAWESKRDAAKEAVVAKVTEGIHGNAPAGGQ